jgi:hypothetical protein
MAADKVPEGAIVMWAGLLNAIPSGWALCDVAGGRPDLRGRFVKGAAPAANPGATGGATTHTHTQHDTHQWEDSHYHPIPTTASGKAGVSMLGHTPHDSPNSEPPYYALAFIIKT